jgi:hypothetical protein
VALSSVGRAFQPDCAADSGALSGDRACYFTNSGAAGAARQILACMRSSSPGRASR